MLLMTVFYAIGLWAAGLELALPVALVAGLLGFVPYLGVTIGLLMALMAAALQFSSPGEVVPILAVFAIAQLLEGFVLTPWLVGDRIGLHPVVVIFTLMAGGQLFGFTGILLALPVGAAIAVGLRHARQGYLSSDTYLK
jgi:predicted PurR-regulated permease PerM